MKLSLGLLIELILGCILLVLAWHLLMPYSWHWLIEEQTNNLIGSFIAGLIFKIFHYVACQIRKCDEV